eukprot:GHRR01031087.1.p1 GENE.GHRR01031087.1~~GHRR01031087.1.p1  ORF type:complete len:294 (+),score=97.03 GHRR01031087.1:483-1364(+)
MPNRHLGHLWFSAVVTKRWAVRSDPAHTVAANGQGRHVCPLPAGKCWLVGVGPGSVEHLTVKAARLISEAEVLVYDDLGAQEVLSLAPADAERVYVGKRGGQTSIKQAKIDKMLVDLCQQGRRVVRLKGGCPSTFSRVSSEITVLAAAGCGFEIVPGLSTATAAPVLAGLPLTDVNLAAAYAVVSAHNAANINWAAFRHIPTLVVLMGGRSLPVITKQLQATDWQPTTPVAVVRQAGTESQTAWFSTLQDIVKDTEAAGPLSPCVIVIGQVAGLPAAWQGLRLQQQRQQQQQQ